MRTLNLAMTALLAILLTFTNVAYAAPAPDMNAIETLIQQKNYAAALEKCNVEITANPNNTTLLYTRIVLYSLTQQPEKANADFETLINATNDAAKKHSLMAYKAAYFGDFNEAKTHIDEAIKLDPNKPDYYSDRAEILMNQNPANSTAALQDIDHSLKLDPNYFGAYFARARIYEKLGEKDKAAQDFATAEKLKTQFIKNNPNS
jgi:tetratricopeptide (TPR) repeat protein